MIQDALGTAIKENDYIAYAVRSGSCHSALRVGKVTKVELVKSSGYLVQEEPRISVTILSSRGSGKAVGKKTTTSIPERVIVLHPDGVPFEVKRVLNAPA